MIGASTGCSPIEARSPNAAVGPAEILPKPNLAAGSASPRDRPGLLPIWRIGRVLQHFFVTSTHFWVLECSTLLRRSKNLLAIRVFALFLLAEQLAAMRTHGRRLSDNYHTLLCGIRYDASGFRDARPGTSSGFCWRGIISRK